MTGLCDNPVFDATGPTVVRERGQKSVVFPAFWSPVFAAGRVGPKRKSEERGADFPGEDIVAQLGEYEMRIPPEAAKESVESEAIVTARDSAGAR